MQPRHQPSPNAYALIERFEGYRRRAARLSSGGYTVGFGHTASAREGVEVSVQDARDLLSWDLRPVARAVDAHVYAPLTQNQYDALVAFAFNVGVDAFRTSDVLRAINAGRPLQAAQALEAWRRADWEGRPQVIDALVRRRAAEKALFLTPEDGFVPAPRAVLAPRTDPTADAPTEGALDLVTSLDGEDAVARPANAPAPRAAAGTPLAAADAVADRLRALFPEEPQPLPPAGGRALSVDAAPSDAEPTKAEPVAPEPADVERPDGFALPDMDPDPTLSLAPPSPPTQPPANDAEPLLLETEAQDDVRPELAEVPEPDAQAPRQQRWPYVFLLIGGAVLFVAGVSAFMRADGSQVLGWVLGGAGVICIATASYFLLQRTDEA